MTYYIYKEIGNDQFRWRLKADNHKIIAISGEGYHHKSDCQDAINLVKASYPARVVDLTLQPSR